MTVKKLTPVLLVDEVEPCVRFWKERLGFEVAIEVPLGNQMGFVSLQKAGVELMYQSYASVEKDRSFSAQGYAKGPSFLYIEVDSLDEVIAACARSQVQPSVVCGRRWDGVLDDKLFDPVSHPKRATWVRDRLRQLSVCADVRLTMVWPLSAATMARDAFCASS